MFGQIYHILRGANGNGAGGGNGDYQVDPDFVVIFRVRPSGQSTPSTDAPVMVIVVTGAAAKAVEIEGEDWTFPSQTETFVFASGAVSSIDGASILDVELADIDDLGTTTLSQVNTMMAGSSNTFSQGVRQVTWSSASSVDVDAWGDASRGVLLEKSSSGTSYVRADWHHDENNDVFKNQSVGDTFEFKKNNHSGSTSYYTGGAPISGVARSTIVD